MHYAKTNTVIPIHQGCSSPVVILFVRVVSRRLLLRIKLQLKRRSAISWYVLKMGPWLPLRKMTWLTSPSTSHSSKFYKLRRILSISKTPTSKCLKLSRLNSNRKTMTPVTSLLPSFHPTTLSKINLIHRSEDAIKL